MELPIIDRNVLTVAQAAQICKVTRVTMWRWVKSGGIRSSATVGGHYRINSSDLVHFMVKHKMGLRAANEPGKKRILIVDDERPVRKYLTTILESAGYEVQACADGFEAGVCLMKMRPNLILLDLIMPRMDGYQTCSLIKKEPETSHIKILAISGHMSKVSMDRVRQCGADGFLEKPLDKETIIQKVEAIIGAS